MASSARRLPPPGGAVSAVMPLPGGARDVGGDDVGGVPVEGGAGAVVAHRRARISVRGGFLDVAERNPGVETGSERFTSHAQWAWSGAGSGRYSSGLVMPGSC